MRFDSAGRRTLVRLLARTTTRVQVAKAIRALGLSVTPQWIGQLAKGEWEPTNRLAFALEKKFGIPASSWVPEEFGGTSNESTFSTTGTITEVEESDADNDPRAA